MFDYTTQSLAFLKIEFAHLLSKENHSQLFKSNLSRLENLYSQPVGMEFTHNSIPNSHFGLGRIQDNGGKR